MTYFGHEKELYKYSNYNEKGSNVLYAKDHSHKNLVSNNREGHSLRRGGNRSRANLREVYLNQAQPHPKPHALDQKGSSIPTRTNQPSNKSQASNAIEGSSNQRLATFKQRMATSNKATNKVNFNQVTGDNTPENRGIDRVNKVTSKANFNQDNCGNKTNDHLGIARANKVNNHSVTTNNPVNSSNNPVKDRLTTETCFSDATLDFHLGFEITDSDTRLPQTPKNNENELKLPPTPKIPQLSTPSTMSPLFNTPRVDNNHFSNNERYSAQTNNTRGATIGSTNSYNDIVDYEGTRCRIISAVNNIAEQTVNYSNREVVIPKKVC